MNFCNLAMILKVHSNCRFFCINDTFHVISHQEMFFFFYFAGHKGKVEPAPRWRIQQTAELGTETPPAWFYPRGPFLCWLFQTGSRRPPPWAPPQTSDSAAGSQTWKHQRATEDLELIIMLRVAEHFLTSNVIFLRPWQTI